MDPSKAPKPPETASAAARSRIRDSLEAAAKVKPDGGRAKRIVYVVLVGTVVGIVVLQMFGVLKNPVVEKVLKDKISRGEIPDPEGTTRPPVKPPDGMDAPAGR